MSTPRGLRSSATLPTDDAARAPAPPRRQPIVAPRKPVDIEALRQQLLAQGGRDAGAGRGGAAAPFRAATAADWTTVTFADIPSAAYDHLLQELLKGMLFETTRAAETEIAQTHASNADARRSGRKAAGQVAFGDEPVPLVAGASLAAPLDSSRLGSGSIAPRAPTVPSLYSRLHTAYNAVMTEFAATEAERARAAAALSGSSSCGAGVDAAPSAGSSLAERSFAATLGGLADRRVRQLERLLDGAREEAQAAAEQLEDLRAAHDQVHRELTRSYREYDKVQRQLLDLVERERQAKQQQQQQQH